MDKFLDCWLMSLTQIAGGPGPAENDLVRFALPAILWAVLLAFAWSGQRHGGLPRERLLVWGFGQALAPVVMIAGSFLRYILVDVLLARLHVQTGLQGEYP
jgi:hypothetical protein